MSIGPLQALVDRLRQAAPNGGGLSDAELVERWARHHDQAAFELIVWRHGRLVLSVCRRLLGHTADVEDAFQATFLVLVRKAGSIRRHQALASWLHTVATRVASQARLRGLRDRPRARAELEDLAARADPEPTDDLRAVLDEEIARLSEKYRIVFILCCLEGKTDAAAARELGCPLGTVLSRLSRARRRLRERLERRGVAPSASLPAAAAAAHLPSGLADTTVSAAVSLAAGSPAAPAAAALMEGVVHAMFVTKLKSASLAAMVFTVLGFGGLAGYGGLSAQEGGSSAAAPSGPNTTPRAVPARQAAQGASTTRHLEQQLEQAQAQLKAAQVTVEKLQKALTEAEEKTAATPRLPARTIGTTGAGASDLARARAAAAVDVAAADHRSALAQFQEAKRRLEAAERLSKVRGSVSEDELSTLRLQVERTQNEAAAKEAMLKLARLESQRVAKTTPRAPSSTPATSEGRAPTLEQRVKTLEEQLKAMQKDLEALRGRRGAGGATTPLSRSGR